VALFFGLFPVTAPIIVRVQ